VLDSLLNQAPRQVGNKNRIGQRKGWSGSWHHGCFHFA
jgi:hypothetical protein